MSALSPRENPALFGHMEAEITMQEALRTRRMHHAWLIGGQPGIGKATLAYRFARAVLAGSTGDLALPPDHPTFRRIAAGSHPDLLTVEREYDEKRGRLRGEIVVDDVRTVGAFMHLTPAEGGWRVVVLDGAEYLNRNAANALLKILEEPPPRALILMVCSAPGRLLPTIRSRCRTLRCSPLNRADMEKALEYLLPEQSDFDRQRLADLAEGAPGRAVQLSDGDAIELSDLAEDLIANAATLKPDRGYDIADRIGKIDEGFSTFMTLLCAALAARTRRAARRPEADAVLLDAHSGVWQGLCRLHDDTERFNQDKRQAVLSAVALLKGL